MQKKNMKKPMPIMPMPQANPQMERMILARKALAQKAKTMMGNKGC